MEESKFRLHEFAPEFDTCFDGIIFIIITYVLAMQELSKKPVLSNPSSQTPVCDGAARTVSHAENSPQQTKFNFNRFPSLFPMDEKQGEVDSGQWTVNSEKKTDQKSPKPKTPPSSGTQFPARTPQSPPPKTQNLKPKYATLATFVEGFSNRLAKTAAQLAVLSPGKMNPIYIHGGTSLGKTHLLEGIYSDLKTQKGIKAPLYMTAEQFTSSFIGGLRQGTASFRNKFRGISALLIDDITFLLGKNATQLELLYLIESLKNQGVQLVFTGDRPLKDLTDFRAEFVARLEAGMVCEIQPPEREILLAIFQRMVQQRQVPISAEVCEFVVSRINSHARQLSGALNRLHATHLATNQPITIAVAQEVLSDLIRNNRKPIRIADIEKVVCETFGISEKSLQSKSRTKQIAHPRMLAMWLARKYTRSALSEIGQYFGGRTHSTVVSAQKKIDTWLEENVTMDCFDQSSPINEVIQKVERMIQIG